MSMFCLNITPSDGNGFCNQMFAICGMCSYAIEHKMPILFISKYLKEIKTDKYCNIGEIINMDKTNHFLKKYNITLIDGYDFEFKIQHVMYGGRNIQYCTDITSEIVSTCFQNNVLLISSKMDLNSIKGDPFIHLKNNYNIDIKGPKYLYVIFSINNIDFKYYYEVNEGGFLQTPSSMPVGSVSLKTDVNINFRDLKFTNSLRYNDGSHEFCDILRNIVFTDELLNKSRNFIQAHIPISIENKKRINTIHLRLENDAIQHWAKENNCEDVNYYKQLLENKYIELIKEHINKDSITILLAHDYDNNVITFMNENKYDIILPPKMDTYRDISAIIDMHNGQICNSTYIGVFESSFSFTLLARINNKHNMKTVMFYFNDLLHKGLIF